MAIDFYTAATPNGYKVAIMLEECGLDYDPHFLDLGASDQKQPDFLEINPNGRIPAIVDQGFRVFESGAILLYLADKTGRFIGTDVHSRSRCMQWLMWQICGLGPMMGQLNVFSRYFTEHLPSAIERYVRESYRLFGVLDRQLSQSAYIVGDDYSIADMSCWPWIDVHEWSGLSLDDYPSLRRWHQHIRARPTVQRALLVPPAPNLETGTQRVIDQARSQLV